MLRVMKIFYKMLFPAFRNLENEALNAWYTNDGVAVHRSNNIVRLLEDTFGDKWIVLNGPYCFFIWRYLKNGVYANPVTIKENMKVLVRQTFADLTEVQFSGM